MPWRRRRSACFGCSGLPAGWIKDPSAPEFWRDAKPVFDTLPSARSAVWLMPPMPRQDDFNAAYSLQSELNFQMYAGYEDIADDVAMLAWHTDAMARVDPHSVGGGYVGDSNLYVHPMAVLRPDCAARLEELRRIVRPQRTFL
jgi:hypothetical protein